MSSLLHHSVAARAKNQPGKIAFRCRDEQITYSELETRASQLANLLHACGLKSMDRVGIMLGKSIETPLSVYGVLAAGGAYVPIDPRLGKDRIDFILRDCGIRILITGQSKASLIKELAQSEDHPLQHAIGFAAQDIASVTTYDWDTLAQQSDRVPITRIQEDDLAYIMYTSGSTGQPKGMMHTHRSGLAYARHATELYQVTSADTLANHAPLHFDISTFDLFGGPLVGASSVIIPEEELMFPAGLPGCIKREALTIWYSVPLALVQILNTPPLSQDDLNSLRWVLFAGEAFPPKHLETLVSLLPHCQFSNIYGPAETNQCTYYHIPKPYKSEGQPVPIGAIWKGALGLILDANDEPVPCNTQGELLVHSTTTMRGYWNREDLNQDAFFHETLFPGFTRKYYRTGDIVSEDENGILHFHGRKDRQIKLRGYRIELDEIESALVSYNAIASGAVILETEENEEPFLAAYLVPSRNQTIEINILAKHLLNTLPHYAVPTRFHTLDALPETQSGKIDRKSLPRSKTLASIENNHG